MSNHEEVWLGEVSDPLLYLTTEPDRFDEAGNEWFGLGVPEGVDRGPQMRVYKEQRAQGHGDYVATSGAMESRIYTLRFGVECVSAAAAEAVRTRIQRLLADGRLYRLTIQRGGITRYTWVQRAGEPWLGDSTDTVISAEIQLYAPNPQWHGADVVITGNL